MVPPQRYLVGSKTEAIIIDEDGVWCVCIVEEVKGGRDRLL